VIIILCPWVSFIFIVWHLGNGASQSTQAFTSDFSAHKSIQVDSKHFDEIDTKILSKKLSSETQKSPYSKIFTLIDEVAQRIPDLSQFLLSIRRELEIEIGSLELEKQEIESKRKEILEKSDKIIGIFIIS